MFEFELDSEDPWFYKDSIGFDGNPRKVIMFRMLRINPILVRDLESQTSEAPYKWTCTTHSSGGSSQTLAEIEFMATSHMGFRDNSTEVCEIQFLTPDSFLEDLDEDEEPEEIVLGGIGMGEPSASTVDIRGDSGEHVDHEDSFAHENSSPRENRIAASSVAVSDADAASIRPVPSEDGDGELEDITLDSMIANNKNSNNNPTSDSIPMPPRGGSATTTGGGAGAGAGLLRY